MSRLTPEEFHNYVVTLSGDEVKRIDLRLKNLKGVENIINGELKLEAQLKSILNSAKNSMRQVLTSLSLVS